MRHLSRRAFILLASLAFGIGIPMGVAFASHQFGDVPNSNPFHADIDALADAGITGGCGGGNYCPKANVTREQMAAFMNRLGALAPGKTPVVNADKVDGYQANALNRLAYAAHDSEIWTVPLIDGSIESAGALSASITAPGAGFLQIVGRAQLYNSTLSGSNEINCWLEVNDGYVLGSDTWIDVHYTSDEVDGDQQTCDPAGGAAVCAPGSYTVDLEIANVDVESLVWDATLMVEFIPFNGAGNAPSSGACGPLRSHDDGTRAMK